jgi:hypothetical protein
MQSKWENPISREQNKKNAGNAGKMAVPDGLSSMLFNLSGARIISDHPLEWKPAQFLEVALKIGGHDS